VNLGQLLDRAYDVLGDVRDGPRQFPADRLTDLVNEGVLTYRRWVEDKWFRTQQELTAGTAVYTFHDDNIRAWRIAYDDCTMRPTTIQELESFDRQWLSRTHNRVTRWTSQGLPHNQYRVYPLPSTSSATPIVMQGDPNVAGWSEQNGVLGRWQDDGVDISFTADPNVVGWDANHGIVGQIDTFVFENKPREFPSSVIGELAGPASDGVSVLSLWLVQKPQTISLDNEEIPLKNAYQIAPLYYALWHTYEEEGDHHNQVLSGMYRQLFMDQVTRGRELMSNPLPFQPHKLGEAADYNSGPAMPFAHQGLDDTGATMNFGWPRRRM
jgi:hypothetical protein